MMLLPKEHGAYGQLGFPLLTALSVSGVSVPAGLITIAVVASFLAHEPLLVLVGLRGPRAQREQSRHAALWLCLLGATAVSAGLLALAWLPRSTRWPLLIPVIPAIAVATGIVLGKEKTWPAEVGVSLAFSGAAFPVALAACATIRTAATVAIVFAANFVLATLAVRVVILKVRGGGNPGAKTSARRAVLVLGGVALGGISLACLNQLLPWTALAASIPGIVVSGRLAASPPLASKLHTIGWALIATSTITSVILIAGLH